MICGYKESPAPGFAFLAGGASSTSPILEFLSFGCLVSVVGSQLRICLWFPYQRDPTIGSAQFLTHGRQFGGKNEEIGDEGWPAQSSIRNPRSG